MHLRTEIAIGLAACAVLAASIGLARALVLDEQEEGNDSTRLASLRVPLQRDARMRAPTHPKPDPLSARPIPTPDPPPPTGIIPIAAPFPSSQYVIEENGFQSVIGDLRTTVYSGGIGRDRKQGVILVGVFRIPPPNPPPCFVEECNESNIIDFGVYPTPKRSGSVRIVDATGTVLTLVADVGTEFRFDVASRRYVRE